MTTGALELAAHITHPVTAAVFAAALAFVAFLAIAKGRRNPPTIVWILAVAFILLGLSPLLASTYLESRGIYRVRIVVLDTTKQPIHDAEVTSSVGGELKRTELGWEYTIPREERPSDGKVTFRANRKDDFLAGTSILKLENLYFPEVIIQLASLPSGTVRGMVEDPNGNPVADVHVWVLGSKGDVISDRNGSFSLPANAADGQQVTVLAQKDGRTAQAIIFAGKPAQIVLRKPD